MKSTVIISKEATVKATVQKVFEDLGGVKQIIPEGKKIILKPNAGHLGGKETAINTSPEFVRAVIQEVRKSNPLSIIIVEASAVGCKTKKCLESSDITQVAKEEGLGCPPVEPLLSWNIMDNKENKMGNIFNEKNIIKKLVISIRIISARLRMRMESKPFIEWLKIKNANLIYAQLLIFFMQRNKYA